MVELILLSLDREWFLATHKAAEAGDADAAQAVAALWDDQHAAGKELACFLCDQPVPLPVFSMVLPEYGTDQKLLAAPLCDACRDLPDMVRWSRSIKMLKKMWSTKGRNVTFRFNRRGQPHPR